MAARLEYLISKRFEVAAQYQRDFLDDPKYKDSFRQDALAYLDFIARPIDTVRLRWRTRFLDEDTANDESLET